MPSKALHMRVEWFAKHYRGEKFHALLCDPPYELGFMGRKWDATGIAFRPDTWAALAAHLHPGAFGMAFASSRGWHRMAVAIEDAGLIIHPSIFGWAFGSGLPKATRIKDVDNAERFKGHRYGMQALKPALEPIIVFQKPYEGRPVDCITQTGAGALNIDGARIDVPSGDWKSKGGGASFEAGGESNRLVYGRSFKRPLPDHQIGRWPANLVLSPEAAARLDEQASDKRAAKPTNAGGGSMGATPGLLGWTSGPMAYYDDAGASRFFFTYQHDQLQDADPLYYCAKASRDERESGLRHLLPTTVNDGRQTPIDSPYQRGETERLNTHPTVKPIDLTRWLATLLLPPKEYGPRRLLVPFAGSGSEMIGAMRAGWEDVTGIEMTREYVEIARARLEFWSGIGVQMTLGLTA